GADSREGRTEGCADPREGRAEGCADPREGRAEGRTDPREGHAEGRADPREGSAEGCTDPREGRTEDRAGAPCSEGSGEAGSARRQARRPRPEEGAVARKGRTEDRRTVCLEEEGPGTRPPLSGAQLSLDFGPIRRFPEAADRLEVRHALGGWKRGEQARAVTAPVHALVEQGDDADVALRADEPPEALLERERRSGNRELEERVLAGLLERSRAREQDRIGRHRERDLLEDD